MIDTFHCEEYFQSVKEFASQAGLSDKLQQQLDYLGSYANREGCMYDRASGMNTRCRLFQDHAPHSFQFIMDRRDGKSKGWNAWFHGGLIYSGPDQPLDGSFPALTVGIGTPSNGWSIHT